MDEDSEEEYTYAEDSSEDGGRYEDECTSFNQDGHDNLSSSANRCAGHEESGRSRTSSDFSPQDGGYIIKSHTDIAPYMATMLNDVSNLLGVDGDQAYVLLQSAQWDKERLLEKFFSNSDKLLLDCGLDLYSSGLSELCRPPSDDTLNTKWSSLNSGDKEASIPTSNGGAGAKQDKDSQAGGTSPKSDKSSAVACEKILPSMSPAAGDKRTNSDAQAKSMIPDDFNDSKANGDANTFECRICCEYCPTDFSFKLGCNHQFCYDCYRQYVNMQVGEGPGCIYMHCPQHKCSQVIPQTVITRLASSALLVKYEMYISRKFIESNKKYRYCPAPDCDKIAVGSGVTNVKCNCGNNFCFRCGDEAHEPCSCDHLEAWNTKCQNESETANWILVNTKKCPQCQSRIEKNQGCNHMNCKLCKHEFCWMCMQPWSEHGQNTGGFYKCNKFEGVSKADDEQTEAEKAKSELNRYLHYYQRYHGHDHSLKFAASQREAAERRMIETQESMQSSWIDVQFLHQAAELVIECRRLLKYTYVLGFFLTDKTPEKQLFEHHQEMLEKNTERLQECTEQNQVEASQVINLTRVTEKFMQGLLYSMKGGIIQDTSTADGSAMK